MMNINYGCWLCELELAVFFMLLCKEEFKQCYNEIRNWVKERKG